MRTNALCNLQAMLRGNAGGGRLSEVCHQLHSRGAGLQDCLRGRRTHAGGLQVCEMTVFRYSLEQARDSLSTYHALQRMLSAGAVCLNQLCTRSGRHHLTLMTCLLLFIAASWLPKSTSPTREAWASAQHCCAAR
jgi:hypothetical protein